MSAETRAMLRRVTRGFHRRVVLGLLVLVVSALGLIQACTTENITGVQVGTVSVSPSSRTIIVGETAGFDATVTDENGAVLSAAEVSWSVDSDGGDVVEVDGDGQVTGLAPGTARVVASFQGSRGQATVTVTPAPSLAVTPGSASFVAGAGGADPDPVTLIVENAGSGTIDGLAAEVSYPEGTAEGWLAAELSTTTAPAELDMAATGTELDAGRYEATVTLRTSDPEDTPLVVPVSFVLSSFTVTTPAEGLQVGEDESEATFSVALDVVPTSDVVLQVSSGDETEVTVEPATLTFTPDNWDTGQTVTVTGVDDASQDGNQDVTVTVSVDAGASDPAYAPALDRSVTVTNVDDDQVGFTVTETNGATVVDESGTTDTLLVRLSSRPDGEVRLTVVASDAGEATASPQTLAFTSSSWSTPQAVVVQGEDDDLVDGAQVSSVTVAVDEANSDAAFAGLGAQVVQVTTVDDDGAGIRVNPGAVTVNEAGSTQAFTVILEAQPTANVTLAVTSGDTGEATVDRATLTFTPSNYDDAQTVIVTGVDDDLVDGDQATAVNVEVVAGSSAPEYGGAAPASVSVTTLDDDSAALAVAQSGGGTAVSEGATSDTIRVALTAEPVGDVVLDVASADVSEVTVSPVSLTFTAANWSTPQNVIATGVDDAAADGNQSTDITISVNAAQSDVAFQSASPVVVPVTNADDDQPGYTVTSGATVSVAEAGGTADVTVVLNTQPASDVVLSFALSGAGVVTLNASALTFTVSNWDTPQSVTLTGIDDDIDDGDQQATLTVSVEDAASDDDYDGVASQTVTVTAVDDDVAGFTLADADALTVSEAGTTDAFTVVLDAEPVSEVVLTVASADPGEVTVSSGTVTFTSATWDTPQTVTLTGVDDDQVDGTQTTAIAVSVNAGASDDVFDGVAEEVVSVATTDDDVPGFTLGGTGSLSVSEGGTTASFSVVLDRQPVGNVVFNLTSGDVGEVTVSPATLTFTSANWNVAQTVTLTGVDDPAVDGSVATAITVAVADGQSDDAWDDLLSQSANVTTTDNDVAGFTLSETTLAVSETGTTGTFTVVLDAQPVTNVAFTVTSSDTGEVTASPATLTFTSGNWDEPQTVTVTGVDDDLVDGSQAATITVAVNDGASNDAFDGVADESVTVTNADDDAGGLVLSDTLDITVTEEGGSDSLRARLAGQPAGDVVVTVTSSSTDVFTAAPATLTFTPLNWSTEQTVTLTGADDDGGLGNTEGTLTLESSASGDPPFDGITIVVGVTRLDNDAPGIRLSPDTLRLTEGVSGPFDVSLSARPASPVTVDVFTNQPGETVEATYSPTTFTFDAVNWSTPQTLTATAVDDARIDAVQDVGVLLSVRSGSDAAFVGLSTNGTTRTLDNDTAGFTLSETTATVTEAGGTDTFTAVLDAQPTSNVVLNVSSADTEEVTVTGGATLTFTPADWATPQTVTLAGADDVIVDGPATTLVTVAVNGAASDNAWDGLASQTVSVTTTDNDVAGFTLSETTAVVTEAGGTDTFTAVLTAQPTSDVVLSVGSGDTGEATVSPATLTFTNANWNTPQTVTVTGVDDGSLVDGPQVTTLTVAVDPSSNAAFTGLAPQTVNATTTDNDAAGFVLAETDGTTSVGEGGTTDTFTAVLTAQPTSNVVLNVSSGDTGEATVSPATLTFTNANWSTPQTVTVTGVDDGSLVDGPQVTTLTVAVDDASSNDAWDPLANQTVSVTTADNDTAGFTLVETGGTTSVDEDGIENTDTLTVVLDAQPESDVVLTVQSVDGSEVTVSPTTLTFTNVNWSTVQTVTLTGVDDSPLADGDQTTDIVVSVDAGSDGAFEGLGPDTVAATIVDTDLPALTISQTSDTTLVQETGATDTLFVTLAAEPVGTVTLNLTTDPADQITLSSSTLTFDATTWNVPDTVVVTAEADGLPELAEHTADVVLTVADGSNALWLGVSDTLTVTITDAPIESAETVMVPSSAHLGIASHDQMEPFREPEPAHTLAPSR